MELEPITRQEKIIAGQDLTPITRLEMFLKQFGGGGGGGSADAVLYTAQTLNDAQKKQARENIDAAGEFVINAMQGSGGNIMIDKTFAQIQAAIQEGKRPALKMALKNGGTVLLPLITADETKMEFSGTGTFINKGGIIDLYLSADNNTMMHQLLMPAFNTADTMPQFEMVSDPTSDLQIATKKYVDDKECILKSTTPGSTKKFKITVDDSGAISATELTA